MLKYTIDMEYAENMIEIDVLDQFRKFVKNITIHNKNPFRAKELCENGVVIKTAGVQNVGEINK